MVWNEAKELRKMYDRYVLWPLLNDPNLSVLYKNQPRSIAGAVRTALRGTRIDGESLQDRFGGGEYDVINDLIVARMDYGVQRMAGAALGAKFFLEDLRYDKSVVGKPLTDEKGEAILDKSGKPKMGFSHKRPSDDKIRRQAAKISEKMDPSRPKKFSAKQTAEAERYIRSVAAGGFLSNEDARLAFTEGVIEQIKLDLSEHAWSQFVDEEGNIKRFSNRSPLVKTHDKTMLGLSSISYDGMEWISAEMPRLLSFQAPGEKVLATIGGFKSIPTTQVRPKDVPSNKKGMLDRVKEAESSVLSAKGRFPAN